MNAVILGAGIVGRAAAWDLVRRGHEVAVADESREKARVVAEEVGAEPRGGDVADQMFLDELLPGVDVVVSAIPYWFGPAIAEAAIANGTHCLDFGGNPAIVRQQLELEDDARRAGVAVIPDCGLAPGLANVLAADCVAGLGEGPIDELRLRVGALPQRPKGALGYQLAFNQHGLINEYAEPCEVLDGGQPDTVEPLTGLEEVGWDRWGPLEAFHTAGGSSTLPARYQGRVTSLDYKSLRYPGHCAIFRALLELGMFEGGAAGSRRQMLVDALTEYLPQGEPDVVLVRIWATAQRNGATVTVGYEIEDNHDGDFSALARTTAFPATALAHLLGDGRLELTGVATMGDAIAAPELLPELAQVGLEVTEI